MASRGAAYYRSDLALVHHLGFASHANRCAPGVLSLLERVRTRDGVVLELGCGSGALTRHLVEAGHRVIATDASPAMLELARDVVPTGVELRRLVLPDDPLPAADAIVSLGHLLNYLPNEAAIEQSLVAVADALRPGGVLAFDVCDLRWGELRRGQQNSGSVGDDWAVITEYSIPKANRYVRDITTFVRNPDGSWRRDRERHDNVLVDVTEVLGLLSEHDVEARAGPRLGNERLPEGLVAIVGERRP